MANGSWAELKAALARGEIRLPTNEEILAEFKRANFTIFDEHSYVSRDMFAYIRRYEENKIRECLGRWVSELPPILIYREHRFVGLGLDGDLSLYPEIYVAPKDDRYIQWMTTDPGEDRYLAIQFGLLDIQI